MECRDWQGVLSALYDGEAVERAQAAEAAAHCDSCGECAAFRSALTRLDSAGAPLAPEGLTERIMRAVDAAAAEAVRSEDVSGEPAVAATTERHVSMPAWLTRNRLWAATAVTAAAAVVIGIGVFAANRSAGPTSPESIARSMPSLVAPPGYLGEGSTAATKDLAASAATPSTVATAAAYLSYAGHVFRPGVLIDTTASALTTIGATTSSLDRPGAPSVLTVFRSPTADGSIFVAVPSGIQQFNPVVRTLANKRYQLATGIELTQYGQWPTLPGRFPLPAQPNGSPTFHPAGTDPLGVSVYAVTTTDGGFAVAPGTASTDPAGGDPNWTWWEPLVIP